MFAKILGFFFAERFRPLNQIVAVHLSRDISEYTWVNEGCKNLSCGWPSGVVTVNLVLVVHHIGTPFLTHATHIFVAISEQVEGFSIKRYGF